MFPNRARNGEFSTAYTAICRINRKAKKDRDLVNILMLWHSGEIFDFILHSSIDRFDFHCCNLKNIPTSMVFTVVFYIYDVYILHCRSADSSFGSTQHNSHRRLQDSTEKWIRQQPLLLDWSHLVCTYILIT